MRRKLTTWNVQHAGRWLREPPGREVLERRARVRRTVREMAPDVLCIQEGPHGEHGALELAERVLDGTGLVPVLLPNEDGAGAGDKDRDREYEQKGQQWIWFFVSAELAQRCRLQAPAVWQAYAGERSWPVRYWGDGAAVVARGAHYRHPQVLRVELDGRGASLEYIALRGLHLKSKVNRLPIERDEHGEPGAEYVAAATRARIRLATEARNVRAYVAARVAQQEAPAIVILGDCNDGPGLDYFERRYLFFDLLSNLQGDVVRAERFFHHALFDVPSRLRWTARFRDPVIGLPATRNPRPMLCAT